MRCIGKKGNSRLAKVKVLVVVSCKIGITTFIGLFEFLFHFNHASISPNKCIPCRYPGASRAPSFKLRNRDGSMGSLQASRPSGPTKIPHSVIRMHPEFMNRDIGHPGVFPVGLPQYIADAYTQPAGTIYDPFCGSGSSILAAEQSARVCYAMELEPSYCDIAIGRWSKRKPIQGEM